MRTIFFNSITADEWEPCIVDFDYDGRFDDAELNLFSFALVELDFTLRPSLRDCDTDGDKYVDGANPGVLAVEFGRTECP